MAAYPASLPQQAFLRAKDERQAGVLRSQMDSGAPKTRKLFTAVIRNIEIAMTLNGSQRATFDTFFITTINDGADSFTILDPLDDGTITVRFKKPPVWSLISGSGPAVADRLWRTTYFLEELP
jgi:hypothetical protein